MASTGNIKVPAPLTDAINGLPDAVFLVMDDGVIIAANSAADKMFGFSHSQLIGSQVDELMPAGARDYHRKVRTEATSDRRPRQFTSGRTFECVRRGGEVFQADIMLSPTKIDGVSMTWAIVHDLDAPSEANAGRRQELNALDVIGHMAASAFDLKNDFAKVAARLKELIPHNRIGVALVCEDDPEMVEIAFLSGDDHPIFVEGERTPISNSATGWVVQKRARVSFTKAKTEFAPAAILAGFEQGYTEFCGTPLFDDDSVIGMLMLSTRNARGFSEFHKSLIDRLAEHLSVGVVNQRMRFKLQAKTREIESVGEIGKKISSSPDLDSAFSAANESIHRLVSFDRLSIYSIDLDNAEITGMFSYGEQLPGFDKLTHELPGEAAQTLRDVFAVGLALQFDQESIAAAAEFQPSFIPYRDAGYQWALVVPLLVTQTPVGMMVFGRKDSNGYSDDQIDIAGRIGEQLAGPVANAFQLTRANDKARVESVLAEIGTVVDTTFDLQSGEHELGPLVRELVDNNSITISSVTQDGMHLRLVYKDFSGIDRQDGWEVGSVHPWKGTSAERIFQTRKPVLVNAGSWADFRKLYPGAAPVQPGHAPKSVINVPLITNDEIFGFLTLRSVKRNAYSEADVAMSVRIGSQLTGSVALSELRRRDTDLATEQAVLASVGGLLGSAVELNDVWTEFAGKLAGLLPFHHISLTGIDKKAGLARVLNDSSTIAELPSRRNPGEMFPLSGTFAADLASADQGIIFSFEDSEQLEKKYPGSYPQPTSVPLRSLIGVPLIWGGEVVAALFIHGLESDRKYTSRDLRLAERIAAQIAGPVAGSLLRESELALTVERETLAQIGSVMGSALDLGEVWPEFAELLSGLLPLHHMSLVSIDKSTSMVRVEQDWWASDAKKLGRIPGDMFPLGGTIAENLVSAGHGGVFSFKDPEQWAREYPGSQSVDAANPVRSALGVPLMWGGHVVAALFIHNLEADVYRQRDLRLAERVAAQIAGPVAGSLLRERESAVTVERETLAAIGSLLSAAQDFGAAFYDVSELAKRLIDFDAMSLIRFDEDNQTLSVVDFYSGENWNDSFVHSLLNLPADGSLAGKAISDRQGFIYSFSDVKQLEKDYPVTARANGDIPARTTIVSPLQWGDKIVAVLWFSRIGETPFLDRELALGERIATQFAGPVAGNLLRTRDAELMAERGVLAGIGELTMSAPDIGSVFEEFADRVQQLVSFDRISIHEIDHQKGIVRRVHSLRSGTLEHDLAEFPLPGTMAERVASTLRGLLNNFGSMEEVQTEFPGAPAEEESQRAPSTIMVPLVWQGEVAIALSIGSGDEKLFGERDLELLERVAAQISGPIAGALLRERDEALIRERSVLTSIGELVGGASGIWSVFKEFVDQVQQLVSFDRMSVHELDHQSRLVRRVYTFRDGTVEHDQLEFPLPGTMVERVADTLGGLITNFASTEEAHGEFPGYPVEKPSESSRSTIMVPLVWQGEVAITLSIGRVGDRPFENVDLELLERVAVQIAGPVAGARLRQRDAEMAVDSEVIAEIGTVMGSAVELGEAWPEFTDLLAKIIEFDRVDLISIDAKTQTATLLYNNSRTGYVQGSKKVGDSFALEGGVAGHVVDTQRSLSFGGENLEQLHRQFPNAFKEEGIIRWKSNLAVPLVWGGASRRRSVCQRSFGRYVRSF